MTQIFSIGGTGHVGGAVLHKLLEQHPEGVQVKVLVRSEDKASRLVAKYPQVQTVIGDLGNHDIIEAASREADIVINTGPDITHGGAIEAALRGLKARSDTGSSPTPYYIQTSGASLIWDEPEGNSEARWWDDVDDIMELSTKGESHTHAVTDKLVRDAAPDVNVAIVSPGFVAGISPSIEHPTPITTPALVTTARAFSCGFQIAQGENTHAWIHVLDLARIFTTLVDDALATLGGTPIERPGQLPLWGPDAYYFGTGEDVPFADFMKNLVPVLHEQGVISSHEIESVNVTEAARISLAGPGGEYDPDAAPPPPDSWAMHIAIMYGVNMRIRASRIERLGWKPEQGSVVDTFKDIVPAFLSWEAQSKSA
ncbi:hypothetical protein VPNG_10159 [Cytospora leucostoma]|uniref:NAD(P)-binding domain-containing protein n=1 Tax=Cytospora leucostoma TaxID=1230097 RepID=A0A423VF63_9PEZI|nr:hypothetical protein VPNG_10159 [Cytospora leucostoma]